MNSRIISLTAMLVLALSTFAVNVDTDRTWYLAGEPMTVSLTVERQQIGTSAETDAAIAYAELCDTRGLVAGVVVSLKDGVGRGVVELPSDLHSGYYVLSAYTRSSAQASRRLVAVVNPLRKSAADDITWVNSSECRAEAGEQAAATDGSAYFKAEANSSLSPLNSQLSPETDGHIIRARVQNVYDGRTFSARQITPSLSIVGRQIHYFEGTMVNDSIAEFNTYGLHGRLPLVLSAVSSTTVAAEGDSGADVSLPIEIISPFAAMLPDRLPHLVFHYQRSEVEARSISMQRRQLALARVVGSERQAASANGPASIGDSATQSRTYDPRVFDTTPNLSYNLDEYRQFLTIREVLLEYVSCVTKRKINGVSQLFVRKEQELYNTSFPTLVLIDGMPVLDVERLLNYDARRVHYINIYASQYTFGRGIYNGILSFVTRSGRLTNYPVEPNMQYLEYTFPDY